MKLSGHSFQFPLLSLEDACRVTSILQLSAVDVGAHKGYAHLDPDEMEADPVSCGERVRRAAENSGLEVSDLFPSFGRGFADRPINDPDPATQDLNTKRFRAFVNVARRTGSAGMTLLPGVIHPKLGQEKSLELSIRTFREYVKIAQEYGLRLSFEPHVDSVVETPELALELVTQVPGLSVTLDYSHFIASFVSLDRVHPLIPYTGHVHVRHACSGRIQVGAAASQLDFVDLAGRLKTAGYTGFMAIEYCWQDWGDCKNLDIISETVLLRDLVLSSL